MPCRHYHRWRGQQNFLLPPLQRSRAWNSVSLWLRSIQFGWFVRDCALVGVRISALVDLTLVVKKGLSLIGSRIWGYRCYQGCFG